MPYIAKGKCVYKKDTGEKVGCTKGSVKDYLAALHANVDENMKLRKYIRKTLKESNLISEIEMKKILYHGTPYEFKQFKPRTTYFSEIPKFAVEYASTKAQDAAMDNDISLVTCELIGNVFDPNNADDFSKLESRLPDKVKVSHGTMWFLSHDFTKEEMVKRLRGVATVEPVDYIAAAHVGDKVVDPNYNLEKFIVVGKDNDFVYTIPEKLYERYFHASMMGYDEHFSHLVRSKEVFQDWRDAIVNLYNEKMGSNHKDIKSMFPKFYQTYFYATRPSPANINSVNPYTDKVFEVTPEEKSKIDRMYDVDSKKLEAVLKSELNKDSWPIRPIEEPIESTWTYFENEVVANIIKELGYDGYVATEDGHKTYAVYNPQKSVRILKIEGADRR